MSKGDSGLFSGTIGSPQLTLGGGYQLPWDDNSTNLLYTIKIKNEFLHGPIWVYSSEGKLTSYFPVVYNDVTITDLCNRVNQLFSSYYKLNVNGEPCDFNFEQEKADKNKMLSMIEAIVNRLEKINDGTFIVDDFETPRLKAL